MKKRLLAMLLVIVMLVGMLPTAVAAVAGDRSESGELEPITVYMTYADGDKIVSGKDGTLLNNVPVQVTDRDGDGVLTMEDGFVALHEAYHTNGAAGYEGESWITKFWSVSTSMVSYVHNHAWVYSPQEVIRDGDQMALFVYQDQSGWSDLYTWFDEISYEAVAGSAASFRLNGYSVFGSGQIGETMVHATAVPEGATVKVYDAGGSELTELATTVAKDGTFSVTFPGAGEYALQAGGVCTYTCTEGYYADKTYTNAPVVPARCSVTVTECGHVDENADKICDKCGANLNRVPVLKEGVAPTASGQVVVGTNYDVTALQRNEIFEDPDGDALNYTSYWYVRSTDGGLTWSETPQNFPPSEFGFTTIQFTENVPGIYLYQFRASDDGGVTFSEDTWTLTLTVVEEGLWDVTFNVGRDMNYADNGNRYPQLQVWKTAGITADGYDYVGSFEKNGETVYVTAPSDYTIVQADGQWKITDADGTYDLKDYQPVTFTDSSFGGTVEEGTEVYASGEVVGNYAKYYASIVNGRYSFRASGWNAETNTYDVDLGGMCITVPTDKNVDGGTGGGTELYLRVLTLYTRTAKSADSTDYFDADSFYTDVICPIMGCHATAGDPYVNSSGYTNYPYLVYAAGNACLYNYYAYPNNSYPFAEGYENWVFARTGNATLTATHSVQSAMLTLKPAEKKEFTVPSTAEFGLYYQQNNFNTTPVELLEGYPVDNGETKTYGYMIHTTNDGNYTWRLSDTTGQYVTQTGWGYPDADLTGAFEGAQTDKHYHRFDQLGSATATRDEADLMVNVDPTGFKTVGEDETVRIRSYRFWQLINSDAGNIMVEPDFHHEILEGTAVIFQPVNGGNTTGNWIDVDPDGTLIAAVDYDAVDVNPGNHGTHGGFFPATDPHRVGVYIVSDLPAGTATASIPRNGMEVVSSRPEAWDYNFDTWYYGADDEAPSLYFTAADASRVEYALVTTTDDLDSSISAWRELTAGEDGNYTVDLLPFRTAGTRGGTVIIRMTDASGNLSYQSVRVAEVVITAINATNPGEPFQPGNDVTLTFDGLYRGIHKISGIFNPTTFYLRYSVDGVSVDGRLGQYQQLDKATITLTIPANLEFPAGRDTVECVFTNGYTYGSMYSAANPFAFLYTMTDTGVGTNFNAVTVNYSLSKYADAVITVQNPVYYTVTFRVADETGAVEDYKLTLTNAKGEAVAANADGTYTMTYGEYFYELTADGYVRQVGSFRLGSATENDNGAVTWPMTMVKGAPNAWDGKSRTEPQKDADGVYLISNGAELAWVSAETVNGTLAGASFRLTDDIDLAGHEWTPIGISAKQGFSGRFDGCGYRIYNLAIHYNSTGTAAPYAGLFGYVANGTVKNLTVEGGITLTSTASVANAHSGGIVGYANGAELVNLTNRVNLTVNRVSGNWSYVAGVVGYASATTIEGASNYGTITGYNYAGGITGYLGAASTVTNSINEGAVTGNNYAAGVSGYLAAGSGVLYSANTGAVSGVSYVGGIAAYLGTGASTAGNNRISGCYNTGSVSGSSYVGGVAGNLQGDTTTAGTASYNNGAIRNCYTTGAVTGIANTGAVIGQMTGRAVAENVYYAGGLSANAVGYQNTKDEAVVDLCAKSLRDMETTGFVAELNGDDETEPFVYSQGRTPVLNWQDTAPVAGAVVTVETVSEMKNPGEEVTVAVNITGNTGFSNFELYIDYDNTLLELKRINTTYYYEPLDMDIAYLPGFLTSSELNKDYHGDSCGFITAATDGVHTKDGTLFTLTFAVKDGTAGGEAKVSLINQKFNLVDETDQDVPLNPGLVGGSILTAASEPKTYAVTFQGKDGQELKSVRVTHDGMVSVSDIPEAPAVENYVFTGWQSGESVYTAEQIAAQKVTAAVTYVATYEIKTYAVTFQGKDGQELKSVRVAHDGTVSASDIPEAPAVENYVFTGWQSGEKTYTAEQITAQKVTAAVTYVATYEIKTYAVTFQGKDGQELKSVRVTHDGVVSVSDIPEAPAVENYVFAGWQSGEKTYTAEQIAAQKVTAAVTYVAAYTPKSYDVTVVLTGETLTNVYAEKVTYTVSARNMTRLATVTLEIALDADYLTDPVAEGLGDWYVIAQTWENGVLTVVAGINSGTDGDGDLLTIAAKPTGKPGNATVTVTAASFSIYEGEGERYVSAILDDASVTTKVDYSKYDVNKDGVVDQLDLTRAQRWFGTDFAAADVDNSGEVDIADLILILNNYTE